jgi:uncharacterized OB-fold protein
LNTTTNVPVLEGWFTLSTTEPQLIGSRCCTCGTYYFPKKSVFCRNPDCSGEIFDEVKLSRVGKLWSFTNAGYQPPKPYVATDPFKPFAIAAVELEQERMVVLGQVVTGVDVSKLSVGMPMELVLETLSVDAAGEKLIWKWKPVEGDRL